MIKDRLDIEVPLIEGKTGQFDVIVDGEVIASRDGGFFNKLFRKGWPAPEDVVHVLEQRLAAIRARQMPDAEKRRRAHFVVSTGLERRQAMRAIGRVIDRLRGRPGHAWPDRWAKPLANRWRPSTA